MMCSWPGKITSVAQQTAQHSNSIHYNRAEAPEANVCMHLTAAGHPVKQPLSDCL